jgi:hypothetical protein
MGGYAMAASAKVRIEREAVALSKDDRAAIACRLIESIDDGIDEELSEEEWNRIWGQEAERRMQAMLDGKMELHSWSEVLAESRKLLKR